MRHHLGRCQDKDSCVKAVGLNSIRSFTSEYQWSLLSSVDLTDIPAAFLSRTTQKFIFLRSLYSIPSCTETLPALISSLLCSLNPPSHHLQAFTLDCQVTFFISWKKYMMCVLKFIGYTTFIPQYLWGPLFLGPFRITKSVDTQIPHSKWHIKAK